MQIHLKHILTFIAETTLSETEYTNSEMSVYPSRNEFLNVDIENNQQSVKFEIFDLTGALIQQFWLRNSSHD